MYKKNFLTDVIVRIDFANPELSIKNELNPNVSEFCLKAYPIKEMVVNQKNDVIITKDINNPQEIKTTVNKEEIREWHFFEKNRKKEITIAYNCLIISIKEYVSFQELKNEFIGIMNVLCLNYKNIKINRVGLRYINQIDLENVDESIDSWADFWKKYINSALVSGLSFDGASKYLSRYLNLIEMNHDAYMVRLQYGIYNVDYPAKNKKLSFLLDTDVFAIGLYDYNEINDMIVSFHEKAKDIFEKAITDQLKCFMENRNDGC